MPQNKAPNGRPNGALSDLPGDSAGGAPRGISIETNGGPASRLSSWKEIAAYLGCDERTCLRWEKSFGLPIHRLEGAKKSRVYAFRDEIDRWQREKSQLFNGQAGANGAAPAARGVATAGPGAGLVRKGIGTRKAWIAAISLLIMAAAATLMILKFSGPPIPHGFRIEGSELIILNVSGKELWRHDTGIVNLAADQYRGSQPQERWFFEDEDAALPHLIFDDLNADGRIEVLFSAQTPDGTREGNLLCFDHKGKELWNFETGRPLEFSVTRFSGDFDVHGFDALDLDGDGRKEIVVIAHQLLRFPTRLAVLDAWGKLRAEYWNSGQMLDIRLVDIDNDGKRELLTYGTNNEYGEGVVIVFDPADIRGCSPQFDEKYLWKGLEPGSQLHYIRIPRADAELFDYYPLDSISRAVPLKGGGLSVWSGLSGLEYLFDASMKIVEVRNSHAFQPLHEKARQAGKVTSVLDAAYFEDLRRRVQYWDKASGSWRPPADK